MSDILIFQTYIVLPRLVFSWSKTFSHLYSCLSKFIKFLSGSICIIDGSQPNRIHSESSIWYSVWYFFMKYRISELEMKKKEWNLYLSLIFYRVNQAMTVLVTIDYDRVTNRSLLPMILSPTDIYYEIWWSKCPAVDWAKWWH